ncbi:MAG: DoxX family protein [Myxococcota bacterium]
MAGALDPAVPARPVPIWLWGPRLVAAVVMAYVGYLKLIDNPADVAIFTQLGMEPYGRYTIGAFEGLCAIVMVSPYAAVGGVMTSAVMVGAILAHVTKLGVVVAGDGGKHIVLLVVVMTSALVVAFVRRRELPLIGETF